MKFHTYADIQEHIKSGNSVSEVVDHYLEVIAAKNQELNVFLEVFEEEARNEAQRIDKKIANNSAGKLAGMVIAIKDNICYANHEINASSKILKGFTSQFTATALQRLLDEDAIIIGRTNCDEFAMGSSNENSAMGVCKNPIDPTRVPGGSSGGSAAAVIGNMCTVSLGSDTGGSIRQPASFCNTVGFKPGYGRVSRYGLIAYASSFDQIGPFSNNIEDSELVYSVMAGNDPMDSTSSTAPVTLSNELKSSPKKIAFLKPAIKAQGIDSEIEKYFEKAEEKLTKAGYEVTWVEFNWLDYLVPIYYILTTAEASSNLARYDGMHFGFRDKSAKGIDDIYVKSRSKGFGEEVKRRILLGTFVLSSGFYDSYFGKAQKIRRLVKEDTEKILKEHPIIALPTTPSGAFKLEENTDDPIKMYLQDIFTVQANITGKPAISLPLMTDSQGLPVGFQLMADSKKEDELFAVSKEINKLLLA
ncbi:Asp-tRNA(Asn)/Glu-tRNA(Gln) amidotransferase subunit GatA [Luteibaculum oceani]|uniref:Glutamyl-tRNA(Gln) amidotransferase subunit A n=1 Tax=Luteibaculum oceani TaxID=1294296 RepID=A0A5C6VKN8_9FLAO|nr:Asp-tRNA(Asn)/Glu-tRNA(Gln) amidotransferase subunit GatA [Luteibaculum oceani]TXC85301.1 Asp-tRNA(Asn)/Glu-tRNA(Gln) amidotransferase subunit GatA [Luteibaculum oceani]